MWLPGIQLMAARSPQGLFTAAHGGHNAESHNHNDVGDFVLYAGGEPVVIDVGFGTYTAKTFSKERYTLWYNNSAYHNLPVINGFPQKPERSMGPETCFTTNRRPAPVLKWTWRLPIPQRQVSWSWRRTVALDKVKNNLTIHDRYELKNMSKPLTQTFMTVCNTHTDEPGKLIFEVPGKEAGSDALRCGVLAGE